MGKRLTPEEKALNAKFAMPTNMKTLYKQFKRYQYLARTKGYATITVDYTTFVSDYQERLGYLKKNYANTRRNLRNDVMDTLVRKSYVYGYKAAKELATKKGMSTKTWMKEQVGFIRKQQEIIKHGGNSYEASKNIDVLIANIRQSIFDNALNSLESQFSESSERDWYDAAHASYITLI